MENIQAEDSKIKLVFAVVVAPPFFLVLPCLRVAYRSDINVASFIDNYFWCARFLNIAYSLLNEYVYVLQCTVR